MHKPKKISSLAIALLIIFLAGCAALFYLYTNLKYRVDTISLHEARGYLVKSEKLKKKLFEKSITSSSDFYHIVVDVGNEKSFYVELSSDPQNFLNKRVRFRYAYYKDFFGRIAKINIPSQDNRQIIPVYGIITLP